METSSTETELFVPCKKVKEIVGTKEFVMLERGANIMASSVKPVDEDKGRCLVLDGPEDAQAAAMCTVMLRLTPPVLHDSITDHNTKCWYYISPAGVKQGPFAARSLMVWLSKEQLPPRFLVQHGPSSVWLPMWLLGRYYQLLESRMLPGAHAFKPMPWPFPLTSDMDDVVMTDVDLDAEIAQLRQQQDFMEAIAEVASMDVDSSGVICEEGGSGMRAAAAALLSAAMPLHLPTPMDLDIDPELKQPGQAHPYQYSELREGDQQWMLQESGKRIFGSELPQWLVERHTRLYLVVDTNVLLRPDGVQLLQQIGRLFGPTPRDRVATTAAVRHGRDSGSGGGCGGSRGSTGDGNTDSHGSGGGSVYYSGGSRSSAALSCVMVVPWTVVVELDGLKCSRPGTNRRAAGSKDNGVCGFGEGRDSNNRGGGGGGGSSAHGGGVSNDNDKDSGDERPVAAMARFAVSLLLSAMQSGDTFFRGQTLQQFREASSHPAATIPLGAACISNDDRILQCCLHLQAELSSKAAAKGRMYRVALLSNDSNLCVKTRMCGIPTTSVRQLAVQAGAFNWDAVPISQRASGPHSLGANQLQAALMDLVQQQGTTMAAELAAAEAAAFSSPQEPFSAPDSARATIHEASEPLFRKAASTGSSSLGGGTTTGWSDATTSGGGGGAGVTGGGGSISTTTGSEPWPAGHSSGQQWVVTTATGAAGGAIAMNDSTAPAPLRASQMSEDAALIGHFDLDENADPLVAALHAEMRRLAVALGPLIRDIFVAEFQDLWTNVIVRPPPWNGFDLLEVLHRHMESVFSERLGRAVARQLRSLVDGMVKNARYFERGYGRPRREPRFLTAAEEFSRGISDILRTFGVAPPPAPPLPAALLALSSNSLTPATAMLGRGGGGSVMVNGAPRSMGDGRGSGAGTGISRNSIARAAAGDTTVGAMSTRVWHEDSATFGYSDDAAATASMAGTAPRAGAGGGGQPRTLHPAAARAAALAQSIGLSVNLGGPEMRGGGSGASSGLTTAISHAARPAAAVVTSGSVSTESRPRSSVMGSGSSQSSAGGGRAGGNKGAGAAVAAAAARGQRERHASSPEEDNFEAKVMAAAAGPDGVVDPQVAQLLQQVMLAMQQAQQVPSPQPSQPPPPPRQQHRNQQHRNQQHQQHQADLQEASLQVMRAVSEGGHGAAAVHQQRQALLQQHQLALQQHQLQQQAQQQQRHQQHQHQHVLQRYYSDPAITGNAGEEANSATAAALASMVSAAATVGSSSVQLTQAEAAARQLQLLQLQHTQHQQNENPQQMQQQQHSQQQQSPWQHLLVQRATSEVEALQAQAQAQAQNLARVPSGGNSILSPTGSMLVMSPGASPTPPAAAWQTLLAETHQRQQQQLQQQQQQQQQLQQHMLLFQQAAAAAAASDGAATAEVAGGLEGGRGGGATPPDVLALLQHAFYAQQQQQ